MGRIAGVGEYLSPMANLQATFGGLGSGLQGVNELLGEPFKRYGDEGATRAFGMDIWKPGKRDKYVESQLEQQGVKSFTDRQEAMKQLEGVNDPEKIKELIGNRNQVVGERKQKEARAKSEAQKIDQTIWSRQTGLMDKQFGNQRQLAQMGFDAQKGIAQLNASNALQLSDRQSQNALRLADKQGGYQLAGQRLQNDGMYRVNDLTSRRSLEGTKYSADSQLKATKFNALAGMFAPRQSAFQGLGMRGLG
jgi:hypothetical protein